MDAKCLSDKPIGHAVVDVAPDLAELFMGQTFVGELDAGVVWLLRCGV